MSAARPTTAAWWVDVVFRYCLARRRWSQLESSLGRYARLFNADGGELLHGALRRFLLSWPHMDPAMAEYRPHVERGLALAYGGLSLHEAVERLRVEVEHGAALEAFERLETAPARWAH